MILRRRGFMAKKRFFFSFSIFGPCHRTSQHYGNIFPILFDIENQKNIVKHAETSGNKVKNPAKVGSREFFFEIFRNWPRFFDLKDVKLNSESNGTG